MMLFYALGLLVLLALCLLASAATGIVAYFLTRKWHWSLRLTAMLGGALGVFVFLANLFVGTQSTTDPAELREAWRFEFESEMPSEVRDPQAGWITAGDSGQRWLKFSAPQAVVDALALKFTPTDKASFYRVSTNPNAPSWWRPEEEAEAAMTYYISTKWKPEDSLSEAVLAYNPMNQTAYFTYGFID